MELMLTDAEHQLTAERQLKYQGTAKVDLDQISLQPLSGREIDQSNVERLHEIFAKDGCQRLDIRNHVTAIVSGQHLRRACYATGLTLEELKSYQPQYPRLCFRGRQVKCLHGQHRLKAAEEFLSPIDRWWTVDLYLDDISPGLWNTLVDEYANEKAPTDGEVYRKIRQYQHETNAHFQNRWWSRLSPNKAKRLRRLTSQDNTYLCAAFDALLEIPGLWNGMSLGSLNSVMALKCDEEVIHYLRHVKKFWATLVNHDCAQMARIDLHTVDALQLYAPRLSKVDRKIVKGKILSGDAFPNFSRSERAAIWENVRSHANCDGIIPSLHTFFRDISYLEVCANAIKRLVPLNKQYPTVRRALVHSFRPGHADTDYLVQTSETTFRRQRGSDDERLSSGYRQLWMYAMRHYQDMAKDIQSGQNANPARAKARAKADESVIHDMATLARKLGFRTAQIKGILQQSPDRQIARAALLKARKPDHYRYDTEIFESLVDQIASCFTLAIPNEDPPTTFTAGRAMKLKERSGIPPEHSQPLDRPYIFPDRLHSATAMRRNLSSLEVRRSVYYAFFGKPSQTYTPSTPPAWSSASEPSSPLFVPRNDPSVGMEPFGENMSVSGLSEGAFGSRQRRSETRGERPERRAASRQGQRISRQPATTHSSPQAEEPSLGRPTRGASSVSEGVTTDNWDNSESATSGGKNGEAGEDDCTEIDENEPLDPTEGGYSRARDLTTVEPSMPGARVERVRSDGSEERTVGDHTGTSGPVQAPSEPLQSSRLPWFKSTVRKNRNRDAIWKPYDPAQRGNRRAARTVTTGRDQRVTDGSSTDMDPGAEHWSSPESLLQVEEYTGQEQSAGDSDAPNNASRRASSTAESPDMVSKYGTHPVIEQAGTLSDAPQQQAAEYDEQHLARAQRPERKTEGDERDSSQILPTGPAEPINGEQVAHDRGPIADQVEELLQEKRLTRERADTLSPSDAPGVVRGRAVARPVTEIPADLPTLVAQLREGNQLDEHVPPANYPTAAHPEGATVSPSHGGAIVQGAEERWSGRLLDDASLPRAPGWRSRISPQSHKPGVRKPRKDQATGREINRAGTRDAAIADYLWGSDKDDDDKGGGTTAGAIGLAQQDAERYPASLPDPEQAQREAIARQEGEDLLFDTPHTMQEAEDMGIDDFEEDSTTVVAARPNRKVTKQPKIAKQKQAGPGGPSKTAQAKLVSRRRADDLEARVQRGVTQLDFTQWDIANPAGADSKGLVHGEAECLAPLAAGSASRGLSSDLPPGRRVTITFYVYRRGEWRTTDTVSVSPEDPLEAQVIADRYARDPDHHAHFYDRSLRNVAVDKCVRAAIDDESFSILMSFGDGLAVTRKLAESVTQLLENVGTAGQTMEDNIL